MINAPNRMAALLVSPERARTRTEAQRRASRTNGARSHGPTTAAGRARSRYNALRHGFAAAALTPPAGIRHHEELFRRTRSSLADEFRPASFTQHLQLDILARQIVQLVRAVELIDALQSPRSSAVEELLRLEAARRDHELCRTALDDLISPRPRGLPRDPAKTVAAAVVQFVEQTVTDLAQAHEDGRHRPDDHADSTAGQPGGDPGQGQRQAATAASAPPLGSAAWEVGVSAFEARELAELVALGQVIDAAPVLLRDGDRVAAALAGRPSPSPAQRDALVAVLQVVVHNGGSWLAGHREMEDRLRRAEDQRVRELAMAPQQLLVLERYRRRLENAVQRQLNALRNW